MLLSSLDMIALCISLTWEKSTYVFISPTSTSMPYVTEQFSSRAVMFVLINLSILIYLQLSIYLLIWISLYQGSCITFIVNLTYCILPNELKFETHTYCIIISICPLCRESILLFFHLFCMLKYWYIKSFVTRMAI
jgi:hypothetical protein